MVKKIIFSFIFLVLMLSVVSAIDTEIKVKTTPHKEVQIAVLSSGAGGSTLLQLFKNNSDQYGNFVATYTGSQTVFDLIIRLKDNQDNDITYKRLDSQTAGKNIYVEMCPEGYICINDSDIQEDLEEIEEVIALSNETKELNETEQINETKSKTFAGISGHSIAKIKEVVKSKNVLYAVLAVVLLGIAGFATTKFKKKEDDFHEKKEKEIKITKLSDIHKDKLADAEKRLKDAQEEIERLKSPNKEKIEEAKRKLIEDERELMRLRREQR